MSDTRYTIGGTVQAGNGSYIERAADRELPELCRKGTFAYVLTPRQMGKSSLMVRCARTLAKEGIQTAIIDLTQIGVQVSAENWYLGLIAAIEDQLGLNTDVLEWWEAEEQKKTGIVQRLTMFFEKVLLTETDKRVVVFVDEIDTTLSLTFTDDFYAAIRYFYNARAYVPAFHRLSFVLIGVAVPGDLIRDPQRTPFNIGQRVDLSVFTLNEAAVLGEGICESAAESSAALKRVMDWTGGHPYLTQRLCSTLAAEHKTRRTKEEIDGVVAETFFGERSEYDNNLQFVRDMLTKRAPDTAAVLETYKEVRRGKRVDDNEQSIVKTHLKLSGIVRSRGGALTVSNEIYGTVFDKRWIGQHLPVNWARQLQRAAIFAGLTLLLLNVPFAFTAYFRANEAEAARKSLLVANGKLEDSTKELAKQVQVAESSERQAQESRADALKAAALADQAREAAKQEANTANALRLELDGDRLAGQGDYEGAMQRYADRIKMGPVAKADDVLQDRARLIELRQRLSPRFEQLWTADKASVNGPPAFNSEGKLVAYAAGNGIQMINADTGAPVRLFKTTAPAVAAAFLDWGGDNFLLAADSSGQVSRWDLASPEKTVNVPWPGDLPAPKEAGGAMSPPDAAPLPRGLSSTSPNRRIVGFSADGTKAAVLDSGDLKFWNMINPVRTPVTSQTRLGSLPEANPVSWTFSPDASKFLVRTVYGYLDIDTSDGSSDNDRFDSKLPSYMSLGYDQANRLMAYAPSAARARSYDVRIRIRTSYFAEIAPDATPSYSKNGQWIAWAATDGIRVRNTRTQADELIVKSTDQIRFSQVAFTPTNRLIALQSAGGGKPNAAQAAVAQAVPCLWTVGGPDTMQLAGDSIALDPGRREVAVADSQGSIRFWGGNVSPVLPAGPNLKDMTMSPDGALIAARTPRQVSIWKIAEQKILSVLPVADGFDLRFSPDSRSVAYGANPDGTVRSFSLSDKAGAGDRYRPETVNVSISADESRMVLTRADLNLITISDFPSASERQVLRHSGGAVLGAIHNPVDKRIASRHLDGEIVVWNLSTGKPDTRFRAAHGGPVTSIDYDRSGRLLASTGGDDRESREINIWDERTGAHQRTLGPYPARVNEVKAAPARGLLAFALADGTIRISDLVTGQERPCGAGSQPVLSVAWSADGKRLAAGTQDGVVKVIDAASCAEVKTESAHAGQPVRHVAFGGGGASVISAGDDNELVMWNVNTGAESRSVANEAVLGLAVSQSDLRVAYASVGGFRLTERGSTDWQFQISNSEAGYVPLPDNGFELRSDVAFRHDGQSVVLKREIGGLEAVSREGKVLYHAPDWTPGAFAELSPNGQYLAYSVSDSAMKVVDLGAGHVKEISGAATPATFSVDGGLFAYTTTVSRASTGRTRGPGQALANLFVSVLDLKTETLLGVVPTLSTEFELHLSEDFAVLKDGDGNSRMWNLRKLKDYYRSSPDQLAVLFKQNAPPPEAAAEDSDVADSDLDGPPNFARPKSGGATAPPREDVAPGGADALKALYKAYQAEPASEAARLQLSAAVNPLLNLIRLIPSTDSQTLAVAAGGAGARFATGSPDGTVRIRSIESGTVTATVKHGNESTTPQGAAITSSVFDASGQRLLTAGRDGSARLWAADTGRSIRAFDTSLGDVLRAEFSPDEKRVVTASNDRTARIYDAASGDELAVLRATQPMQWARFSPDGLRVATGGNAGELKLWKIGDAKPVELAGHSLGINTIAFSPDGKLMVTASDDRTARLWSVLEGRELVRLPHSGAVLAAAFSPDGHLLLTAGSRDPARLWDGESGRLIRTFAGHPEPVRSAQFDSSGSHVLTVHSNGITRLWETATGRELSSMQTPAGTYTADDSSTDFSESSYSDDEKPSRSVLAAFGGADKAITAPSTGLIGIWRTDSDAPFLDSGTLISRGLAPFATPSAWKNSDSGHRTEEIAFSHDGKKVVTATSSTLWLQSAVTGAIDGHVTLPEDSLLDADISPDGKLIVLGTAGPQALVYAADSFSTDKQARPLRTLGHGDRVRNVRFSPDGKTILTTSRDKTAKLWSASTGELIRTLAENTGYIRVGRFSPDGSRILTADTEALVWETQTGKLLRRFPLSPMFSLDAQFSPDGNRIASVNYGNNVEVWDVDTGKLLLRTPHLGRAESVMFSEDGNSVRVGNFEGSLSVWDLATGKQTQELTGHTGSVNSIYGAGEGRIATASGDGSGLLWDTASGKVLARFEGAQGGYSIGKTSPDGTSLVHANGAGDVFSWPLTASSLPEESTGHGWPIQSLSVLNGAALTVDSRGNLRQWNLKAPGAQPAAPEGFVRMAAFAPDSKVVSLSDDPAGALKIRDSASPESVPVGEHYLATGQVAGISGDGKSLISSDRPGSATICEAPSGKLRVRLETEPGRLVQSVGLNRDGTRAFTDETDGHVAIWDAVSGKKLFEYHINSPTPVFSPDGNHLLFSQDGFAPTQVDVRTGSAMVLPTTLDFLSRFGYNGTGTRVWSVTTTGKAGVWDALTGAPLRMFNSDRELLRYALVSPDGERVLLAGASLTFSDDGDKAPKEETLVVLRDLRSGDTIKELNSGNYVWALAFDEKGERFATGDNQGHTRVYAANGDTIKAFDDSSGAAQLVEFSSDGKRLIVSNTNAYVSLWDIESGEHQKLPEAASGTIYTSQYSSGGRYLAIVGERGTVRLWETETRKNVFTAGTESLLAFSAAGKVRVAGANSDGSVWLWEQGKENAPPLISGAATPSKAVFSPDGANLALSFPNGNVEVWDTQTRRRRAQMKLDGEEKLEDIGFGADPGEFYLLGGDGTLEFVSPEGKVLSKNDKLTSNNRVLAVSRDWIAVADTDEVQILQRKDYQILAHLTPGTRVTHAEFSADGKVLIAAGEDRTVRMWDFTKLRVSDEEARKAIEILGRVRPAVNAPTRLRAGGTGLSR
jgi:WD40 repeat protein